MREAAASPFVLPPADWARLRQLLDEALALPEGARAAWLGRLAPADAHLAPHLQRLLLAPAPHAAAGLLDTLPSLPADAAQAADPVPSQVGPYRLLQELGSGGMASVWLAERTDVLLGRRVALKLPHQPFSASRRAALAERLQREREILATLEHPNIARLYDAGVTDGGQPWLALELVHGQRIDEHCRDRQLPVPARLRLFLQAVRAVAHAHARLVVHRDLKPANMLVTAEGELRLLDFGIAKLMDDGLAATTELTQQAGRALTPQYASPEQLLGEALGTASDIYSLGVVLFELLTQASPYAAAASGGAPAALSRSALERAVLDAPTPRPSTVVADAAWARTLRGDLDSIVLTALKKAPGERYATADALAADIESWLAHRPVQAQADHWAYRLRKALRRNRLAVAAAAGMALALTAGSAAALWQAALARAERDKAQAAAAEAREGAAAARAAERAAAAEADLSSFLLSDLNSGRPGTEMTQQLERAVTMVQTQYRQDAALRGRMLLNLALSFRWIGLHERAEALIAEAEPLLQGREQAGALAHLLCIQASALARTGQMDAARGRLRRAEALASTAGPAAATTRAECLLEQAWVARYASDPARATQLVEQALQHLRRSGRADSELASEALNALSRAQHEAGRYAEAAASARASIDTLQRIGREHTPGLRNAWGLLARALRDGGRPLEAQPAHGGQGRFDPTTDDLPMPVRYDHAVTLIALGRHAQALALLRALERQALALSDINMQRFIALRQLQAEVEAGRAGQARARLQRVQAAFGPLRQQRQARVRPMLFVAAAWALEAGEFGDAQTWLDEAEALGQRSSPDDGPSRRELHGLRARLAWARGDHVRALAEVEVALKLSREQAIRDSGSLKVADALLLRSRVHAALGRAEAARADALEALVQARDAAGEQHPSTRAAVLLAQAPV